MFKGYIEVLAYDNEEIDDNLPDGEEAEGQEGGDEDGNSGKKPRVFTQAEVDEMVVKRNKGLQQKYQSLEKQYEDTLRQKNLTAGERQKIQSNLEQLQAEMRTSKEQAEYEAKKAKEKYELEIQNTKKNADFYKNLYEKSTIERAISDAAASNEGFAPSQFIAYLGPRTRMVAELDSDGEETGNFTPKVEWSVTKEDGSSELLSLSPNEAVNKMKEDTNNFGNMFRPYVSAGIGAGTAPSVGPTKRVDPSKISTQEYMELAKTAEGRRKLGIKR